MSAGTRNFRKNKCDPNVCPLISPFIANSSQYGKNFCKVFLAISSRNSITGNFTLAVFFFLDKIPHFYSEMVAPLDIYHNSMGVANGNEEERRRRHRHHHHSQHRQPRNRHSGYQYDPNQAEVSSLSNASLKSRAVFTEYFYMTSTSPWLAPS